MSARDAILRAVASNKPVGDYPLPDVPTFKLADKGNVTDVFIKNLESMGGNYHEGILETAIRAICPDAKVIASTIPEVTGNLAVVAGMNVQELATVDVAVLKASFGVAETGSVLLTDERLGCNAVAYLSQHLVVLLDPDDIVPTMHEAYLRPELHSCHYASFHTGPSATADIEGVLIHGAQGVRSLTVVFL